MRKNRTKHEAKKPRLAKRALALCFALIFVCSCLLPVFAHSEAGALESSVSSEQPADPAGGRGEHSTGGTGDGSGHDGAEQRPGRADTAAGA